MASTVLDTKTLLPARRAVGTRGDMVADQYGSLQTTQFLPRYAQANVARKMYSASTGAGTAKAPYVAIPTTTATWALYNGGSGNTCLVVTRIWAWLVSGTSGMGEGIMAGLSTSAQAAAVSAYASSVSAVVSPGAATTEAVFGNAVTLAAAPAWQCWAGQPSIDASDSTVMQADVDGYYVVPAGFALGAGIYNIGGGTALYGVGFDWMEIILERS